MDEKPYTFRKDIVEYSYRFESVSQYATISKLVLFTAIDPDRPNFYNLALVDELEDGNYSDTTVSNNEDMTTILATVFRIIEDFLNRFPTFIVYFEGSDARRNRLYRIALGQSLDALTTTYELSGLIKGRFESFERDRPYEAYLIYKRL